MPIKIADGLSAKEKLHEEGIFTIDKGWPSIRIYGRCASLSST